MATADPTGSVEAPASGWRRHVDYTTSSSSYVAFRIAFGVLIAIGQIRFLARGWVDEFFLAPRHHLTYPGFDWVRPLTEPLMYTLVGGLAVLGIFIAVGVHVRLAAALFAVGFAYCELIDAALYLNHYWFMTLTAVLLVIVPGPAEGRLPVISVWALRAQLGAVYVFAGLAKLNADWLFRAEPLRTWLAARTDRPIIGGWLDEPVVAFSFSWAGAAFDLTIVAWLLWRRSRPAAYVVLVVFHVATAMLFQIGMFPWVMIALTPIFFAPDWGERFRVRALARRSASRVLLQRSRPGRPSRLVLASLAGLMVLNVVVPFRHLAADGNVRWNDDGYLLSWRVMLTERAGHLMFRVTDPSSGAAFEVRPDRVLGEWQAAVAVVRADLILTTAHLLADDLRPTLGDDVEVRSDAFVAWNGRVRERWIDPNVDLAGLDRTAPASAYVLPAP